MAFSSAVYIVCSPRPRIGRTLLARLLIDFFLNDRRDVAAFDLNAETELTQFMPRQAEAADITSIKGQMGLFDRLITPDGTPKVIDLGPAALSAFRKIARETGFVEEAQRRGIAPVFLYIVSADQGAADAYAALVKEFPDAIFIPVHNEANGKPQHRDKFTPHGASVLPLKLPLLSPGLRKYFDQRPFSFFDSTGKFLLETPLEAQMQMQRWMRQAFVGFREMELRILLGDVQASLQAQLQEPE